MRRRQLKRLWARLKQLSTMQLTREELLMKLGAARDQSRTAWRLVMIEVAAEDASFSYRLDRNKLRQTRWREGRYLLRTNLVEVHLREWSRMADDLQQERSRLASRLREQLWRYYPQMLELADDLAADWFLDLWSQASTPARAARLRATTIERFIKKYHLRRWQASEALRILKQKPLSVAPGVVEAASDHIRTLAARIRRFGAKPDKKIVDRQAASPSSWKTPFMAAWMAS